MLQNSKRSPVKKSLTFAGKRALVRVDFNVSLNKETLEVTDDIASMRTLPQVLGITGARIVATVLIFGACWAIVQLTGTPCYLFFYLVSALISIWLPVRQKDLLWLEFLWELPLLMVGVVFFI